MKTLDLRRELKHLKEAISSDQQSSIDLEG